MSKTYICCCDSKNMNKNIPGFTANETISNTSRLIPSESSIGQQTYNIDSNIFPSMDSGTGYCERCRWWWCDNPSSSICRTCRKHCGF